MHIVQADPRLAEGLIGILSSVDRPHFSIKLVHPFLGLLLDFLSLELVDSPLDFIIALAPTYVVQIPLCQSTDRGCTLGLRLFHVLFDPVDHRVFRQLNRLLWLLVTHLQSLNKIRDNSFVLRRLLSCHLLIFVARGDVVSRSFVKSLVVTGALPRDS